ncbi:unnamed protein product [Protopolystoma xenopodis]|uniref:Uncharacterized protein n=1 Tax=Protopolystoma xenopodis TaxID=117903 RepID=A0A448WJB3_9PLAT|nr:unnamed protein product [Protopolystoma xenopodis]
MEDLEERILSGVRSMLDNFQGRIVDLVHFKTGIASEPCHSYHHYTTLQRDKRSRPTDHLRTIYLSADSSDSNDYSSPPRSPGFSLGEGVDTARGHGARDVAKRRAAHRSLTSGSSGGGGSSGMSNSSSSTAGSANVSSIGTQGLVICPDGSCGSSCGNSRPQILIGGLTFASLCRARKLTPSESISSVRRTAGSGSSRPSGLVTTSTTLAHSSGSSDEAGSKASTRCRRGPRSGQSNRSAGGGVEFITTFGSDGDEDDGELDRNNEYINGDGGWGGMNGGPRRHHHPSSEHRPLTEAERLMRDRRRALATLSQQPKSLQTGTTVSASGPSASSVSSFATSLARSVAGPLSGGMTPMVVTTSSMRVNFLAITLLKSHILSSASVDI